MTYTVLFVIASVLVGSFASHFIALELIFKNREPCVGGEKNCLGIQVQKTLRHKYGN